jgi:NhaB family Na+:H+ antiporter
MSTETATATHNPGSFMELFLGPTPMWYKQAVIAALVLNVPAYFILGPLVTSWIILFEFIFTLAMALKCFPLQPGGLLALQVLALGLTDTYHVYDEVLHGLPVILLVVFMVAAVHFLREMLFKFINKVLLGIRSRVIMNFATVVVVAVLSAFLDALTILAILIALTTTFYLVYERVITKVGREPGLPSDDSHIEESHLEDLEAFRGYLRGLLMHGAVATAIGGVSTLVGEPENIVIGSHTGWDFVTFFLVNAPATMPTLVSGFIMCILLEKIRPFGRFFGYGNELPENVRTVLADEDSRIQESETDRDRLIIKIQICVFIVMVVALSLHLAEVGLIGLGIIILASSMLGETNEHEIGKAFVEGLPFASLLVVFFAIVAMINDQEMFTPVMEWVLSMDGRMQVFMVFLTNGALSAISDNVFVATIYMDQISPLLEQGVLTRELYDAQSVAVVMGTGIPSMSTPNGQAAFLFLLMSGIAPKIRLGYIQMVFMALPYFIITTITAGIVMYNWL